MLEIVHIHNRDLKNQRIEVYLTEELRSEKPFIVMELIKNNESSLEERSGFWETMKKKQSEEEKWD